jgi:hypothetical protein
MWWDSASDLYFPSQKMDGISEVGAKVAACTKIILDSNPSGTTPDDLEKITQEKYQISAGKEDVTKKNPRLNYMQLLSSSEITPSLILDLQVQLEMLLHIDGEVLMTYENPSREDLSNTLTPCSEKKNQRHEMLMRQFVSAAPPHIHDDDVDTDSFNCSERPFQRASDTRPRGVKRVKREEAAADSALEMRLAIERAREQYDASPTLVQERIALPKLVINTKTK